MSETELPKVSVSVVTYNHGDWLAECLESIVSQVTDFSFEVVVGDDASTDGRTREIISLYANRYPNVIRPVFREKNVGADQNYFDVVSRCRGEYIAHIDGDDRMLPGKLKKQSDFLDRHPECSIVAHEVRLFDGETGRIIKETLSAAVPPLLADLNYLVESGCYFAHLSKMYRRTAIQIVSRSVPTVDFFLHIDHARSGLIGFINEVLGEYRKHRHSMTQYSSQQYKNVLNAHLDAYDYALHIGVKRSIVMRARCKFKYVNALPAFKRRQYGLFRDLICLTFQEIKYASLRHIIVFGLRNYPRILNFLWMQTKGN